VCPALAAWMTDNGEKYSAAARISSCMVAVAKTVEQIRLGAVVASKEKQKAAKSVRDLGFSHCARQRCDGFLPCYSP